MPVLIERPATIPAAGTPPKTIHEYIGRASNGHYTVSVARMESPQGWSEPGQTPEFQEVVLVLRGMVRVEHRAGTIDVREGQAVLCRAGEWVRFSTPEPGGADHLGICIPAFSPHAVRRDAQ
jgi:mannose-6-phosphate isomerase-like protein (cupin superfamily)